MEQILAPAHPEPIASRWLKRIHSCPSEAGEAIAGALDSLRTSSDLVLLERVTDLTQYLHDASVFEVSLDVARDTAATTQSRVLAFRTLMWSMDPAQRLDYEELTSGPRECMGWPTPSWNCKTISSAEGHFYHGYLANDLKWPAFGRPLPADFVPQVAELCGIGEEESEPELVRLAARHACEWDPDPHFLEIMEERGGGSGTDGHRN